jgi:hypothetical protein
MIQLPAKLASQWTQMGFRQVRWLLTEILTLLLFLGEGE